MAGDMMSHDKHFDHGILAIDPATQFGYAYFHDGQLHHGSRSIAVTSYDSFGLRAWRLFGWIVDKVGHEEVASRVVYEYASFGRGQYVHENGMLCGAIEAAAHECSVSTQGFGVSSIKSFATGYGKAKKEQMMRAVELLFGVRCVDDNAADAVMLLALATSVARGKHAPPMTKRGHRRKRTTTSTPTPRLFK